MAKKMVRLGKFIEDPDNVSEATPEEIERLAGKLRRVPMGLTAMRIAYVTDSPGGWMVVSGNKRLRCLKAAYGENGEVPAEWFQDITAMSEDERHEFRLNANISDGHFNIEKLLAQYDLDELNAAGLEDLLEACDAENQPKDGETDPDAVPETPEEPVSERGKIYQCGEHLLMCGDSTSAEDMDRLLAGGGAAFVFTDPPYGVAIGTKNATISAAQGKSSGSIKRDIIGDTLPARELYKVLVRAFTNLRERCEDRCSYYVSSPQGGDLGMMMMMMRDSGLTVRHMLIWVKSSPTFSLGRLDYDYQHEPIFYTWTKRHDFYAEAQATVIDDTQKLEKMSKAELKALVHALQQQRETSVVYCDRPTRSKLHPTMKPVALVARFMRNSSRRGEICADIFGGSGSTMIAAEQLGRKARLMELDPHYCDVIRKRWAEFTHGEGCDWESLTPEVRKGKGRKAG